MKLNDVLVGGNLEVKGNIINSTLLESNGNIVYGYYPLSLSSLTFVKDKYRSTSGTWDSYTGYGSYYGSIEGTSIYVAGSLPSYLQIVIENPSGTFKTRLRTTDNNLPTIDNPYKLSTGDIVYISGLRYPFPSSFAVYSYRGEGTKPTLSNDIELNTNQLNQVTNLIATSLSNSCILEYSNNFTHSKATEGFKIFIPSNNCYIEYDFIHTVDESIKCDCWRLDRCVVTDMNHNEVIEAVNSGPEWEMAIHLADRTDFIGGGAHGDEEMTSISFYVDGKYYSEPSEISEAEFREFKVLEVSTGYDPNDDSTEVLTHYKEYNFTNTGIKLNQKVLWLTEESLDSGSYLGMLPAHKTSNNTTFTDAYFDNVDYQLTSISDVTYPVTVTGATKIATVGTTSSFMGEMTIDNYPNVTNSSGGYVLLTDNSSDVYNKAYFVIAMSDTVTQNEIWSVTNTWHFEYTID